MTAFNDSLQRGQEKLAEQRQKLAEEAERKCAERVAWRAAHEARVLAVLGTTIGQELLGAAAVRLVNEDGFVDCGERTFTVTLTFGTCAPIFIHVQWEGDEAPCSSQDGEWQVCKIRHGGRVWDAPDIVGRFLVREPHAQKVEDGDEVEILWRGEEHWTDDFDVALALAREMADKIPAIKAERERIIRAHQGLRASQPKERSAADKLAALIREIASE